MTQPKVIDRDNAANLETNATDPKDFDPALDPTLDQVSRRGFLGKAGAAAALATGLAGEADAQATKPKRALDDDDINKRMVHYNGVSQNGARVINYDFNAFLAQPFTNTKRGSVIVIHEIFGLTDHIKDVACRFAQAGYTALAPDLFTREGKPPAIGKGPDGFKALMEFVTKIPDSQLLSDLSGALLELKTSENHPTTNGKVGCVGYCWGGRLSMLLDAVEPDLNAAVAYYGRISGTPTSTQPNYPIDLVPDMKAPLLGHFGAEDTGIPPAEADKLRRALKLANKTAEIYVYDKAGHAFNNDTRESYRPEAAKLAYQRTLDWFAKYLAA